jgi:predicted GNAT family acetyltransferase
LIAGLRLFEDQWGHHHVHRDSVRARLEQYEARNVLISKNDALEVVGMTRATVTDGVAWIDAPSLHTNHRHTGLHTALLSSVLAELLEQDATSFTLEAWARTQRSARNT